MADRNDDANVSRRTFMRTTGAAAGAGLLGVGAAGSTAAADEDVERAFLEFTNARVQQAANAWERGYRGRADRTLALTDSGVDSQHPAVGIWNGVVAETRGGFETWRHDYPDDPSTVAVTDDDGEPVAESFSGATTTLSQTHDLDVPGGTERITLELDTGPGAAIEVELHEGDREEVAALRDETDRTAKYDFADPATYDYRIEVSSETDDPGTYEVRVGYREFVERQPEKAPVDDPMAGIDSDDRPGVVGWNNDSPRYHYSRAPRDLDSHGTHVTGIMTGSGRASAIDPDRSVVDEPHAVLLPGDVLTYDVTAAPETGVFASAYGENIELVIEGPDGRQLARSAGAFGTSEETLVNNKTETPTVHETGDAGYTVHVRASEGEAAPARVERVAAGAFKHFSETEGDTSENGDLGFHSGVAPGFSVVGVTDLSTATNDILGEHPAEFASSFNMRAVNMSWGLLAGYPGGTVAGVDPLFDYGETFEAIRDLAANGVLTVAAAGNDGQPASGNDPPSAPDEAVSVVATGPLDGIASYSSGGIGAVDDESGEPYGKPEITAIGGIVNDLDHAAMPGDQREDAPYEEEERHGTARTFAGKGGTSMASPSVCGEAGLVAQAMEEDAPPELRLPAPDELAAMPDDEARAWTLRVKQAMLATANTTAFHAAPYHRGKTPAYTFGERDPYEGFGRANPGVAIDAVSRSLFDGTDAAPEEVRGSSTTEVVGLNVPGDEQTAAGYVRGAGEYEISVEFSHYSGGNEGMTKGDPHVDLFVYDAVEPEGVSGDSIDGAATGDPNVVASAQGLDGEASVSFEADGGVFYVVAKLVNVPGVVNGFDVQAHLDLDVGFRAPSLPTFSADGRRQDDGRAFTGGQTDHVRVTITDFDEAAGTVVVRDEFPPDWEVQERFSDGEVIGDGRIEFGTVDAGQVADDRSVTFEYFAEAPEGPEATGSYQFGSAEAEIADRGDDEPFRDDSDTFGGTDTNTVIGPSQNG